jgi:hypothetical protein
VGGSQRDNMVMTARAPGEAVAARLRRAAGPGLAARWRGPWRCGMRCVRHGWDGSAVAKALLASGGPR